ncbi:MAG: WG repeat-containing protein [Acidobacteria bacterium]|nr:WG repeat-containing protein [Acidobacteriota bacterium]
MPQYDDIGRFSEGLAAVRIGEKWGVIALDGSTRLTARFDSIGEFQSGVANAAVSGRAGFIDTHGGWVIRPEHDRTERFFGDLAIVQKGEVYSYIRRDGRIVWTSERNAYVQAPPFIE